MLRIPVREQLAALILLASLIGLGVISIATWVTNHNFVLGVRSSRLSLIASLKSSQLSSNLNLMQNSVQFVASRILIQDALEDYNDNGNNSAANWDSIIPDMQAALGGGGAGAAVGQALLLQSMIFPASGSGPAGSASLLNTTGADVLGAIKLPYNYPNGTAVYFGDEGIGYPPALYPNFTYPVAGNDATARDAGVLYDGALLKANSAMSTLLLGPIAVNTTLSLMSLTIPVINNTSAFDVLAWLTVVLDARLIMDVISSSEGLDATGEMLLIGPANSTNHYSRNVVYTDNPDPSIIAKQEVNFVLPLATNESARHPKHTYGTPNLPFLMTKYPAVVQAVTVDQNAINNAGADIATTNEAGQKVSAGFAALSATSLCDWIVIVEQARSEVWEPITHLRRVLLACIFGTIGAMILLAWPLAHFASLPIRQLREATMKTVMPQGYAESTMSFDDASSVGEDREQDLEHQRDGEHGGAENQVIARKEGFFSGAWRRGRRTTRADREEELRRRQFKIPGKVKERRHVVQDELSDLTRTFNEMSDELMMQYERLEERVRQRTAELELSKKAAEAANESKTLFIANISHELKTPLNGILGMCAVCMQEDDPIRLRRSLGIIYKSGDLLLNLLNDLLTFSKNQVGKNLSLDEKEFRLRDVSSQILAIFDKQAKEGQIDLRILFKGGPDEMEDDDMAGITDMGRVKDMVLWGDTHRILQVVINLVSNSLKFTPSGGSVTLTVRCLGETSEVASRKTSLGSKTSKKVSTRQRSSDASLALNGSLHNFGSTEKSAFARIVDIEHDAPPPGRTLMFEFEVVDTGPGIAEEQHQQIFEPFVQGDLGLSKKFGGTGLGLSICSQLAGLMRGKMALQSELGKGSTFSMRIPLRHIYTRADSSASSRVDVPLSRQNTNEMPSTPSRNSRATDGTTSGHNSPDPTKSPTQAPHFDSSDSQPRLVGFSQPFFASNQPMESPGSQPGAMEQIEAAAASSGKIRVLVAEDNKVNQEVVLRMLKLEDIYDVTVAKDGQEALDRVKESMSGPNSQPYNLIFMDVQMPNLDGLQSTRLIRETGYDAPIVALTAFAEESNVKDCLDSGMNYFLSKPIRRPALKKVLKEYCAPIQEVDEEPSTPEKDKVANKTRMPVIASPSQNTTTLVVSRPNSLDGGASPRKDAARN